MPNSNFIDDRHNLYCGWVLGIAIRNGLVAEPEMDEGGYYLPRLKVRLGEHSVTVVVPYPPADWNMEAGL